MLLSDSKMSSPRRSHREKISPYRYTPSLAVAKHKARQKNRERLQLSSQFTPNRLTQGKTTVTNYSLNPTKAAQKMIDATEQLNVQAEFKRGTLVMKFSPAAFLMFHKHTLAYYEKSSRLTAISHFKRDKNNLIVEESLSIKPITNDKVGRRQVYRINLYKTAFSVEANGREIKDFIKNDLHEILSTLPSVEFLNNMNTAIQDSCKSFLSDQDSNNWIQSDNISSHSAIVPTSSRDENNPLLTNLNRTQNLTSIETIVATDSTQSHKNCASCSENIINFEFIMCITCEEKFHFQCQNITSDQYKSMSIDELEQFKCTQCNSLINDLSISEIETDPGNMVQFTGSSCSPDTLVKTVQINRNLEKSPKSDPYCGNSKDMQQDHTGKQVHTAQQQSTNIGAHRNNSSPILQTDNNSIKQPKQTGPKKQKILKQDDLKSKLAVAEAHIAALENTILDNNNLIRNMKLTQLGQNDYHQNGPDLHSYRQTPSSISANCSNCHCSQVDNRIRDLEREMSNLRLQHLENQFFTLRQQSQNLVNLQATAHMNQQGPVHTIHSQHVVQPSPTSVQNHWLQQPVNPLFQQTVPAPPPYMFRQPSRTQMAPSQNIPNSHMQAQHPQMIYHRAAVATQLSSLDSNNSIAVTPSIHPHSQTHHMSSTQGKVQINTSSNKIVPELITKSYVSNDIRNSSSGDSKTVLLSLHLLIFILKFTTCHLLKERYR